MTAQALLKDLYRQGIRLRLVDNQLKIGGFRGVVTEEIRLLVDEHRAELTELFSAGAIPQKYMDKPSIAKTEPSTEIDSERPDLAGEEVGTRFIASAVRGEIALVGDVEIASVVRGGIASVACVEIASSDKPSIAKTEPCTEIDHEKPDLAGEEVGTRFITSAVREEIALVGDVEIASVGDVEIASVVREEIALVGDVEIASVQNDELLYNDPFDDADLCSQCGTIMEYYSDVGVPYCAQHRYQASQEQCQASPALALVTQAAFFGQDISDIVVRLTDFSGRIALDLETTGLSPQKDRIVSISLGVPGRVFVLDMRPYYDLSPERQAEWRFVLQQFFTARADIVWVGHNLKFDWSFLAVQLCIRLPQVYDTMLAEQILHAGHDTPAKFFTLLQTAQRYDLKVSKQPREWFVDLDKRPVEWAAPFPAKQLVYMVQDIEIAYQVAESQYSHLEEHELEAVVQLENQALPAIASMEVYGVLIDNERWKHILSDKRARKDEMEQELVDTLGAALHAGREQKLTKQIQQYKSYKTARAAEKNRLMQEYHSSSEARGKSGWEKFYGAGLKAWDAMHPEPIKPEKPSHAIKLSSPGQVKEALACLGIEVASTEEEVLEGYRRQHPVIEHLLAWRKLNHFCHTFGENLLAHIQADGRIRASFFQAGAVSGRITCREPNLQQIPKRPAQAAEGEDVRRCFIAPEGSFILTADLSNIELRILGEISEDPTVLRLFAQGKDMHAETARAMFGLADEINTREHLYKGVAVREIAKTINFGLIYGMGVQGLANRIGVSKEEAQNLVSKYFATYAGINKWRRQATEQTFERGYAATLAGRKRFFPQASEAKEQRAAIERAGRNHPIQGTNADILKRALALLYQTLPESVHLILCVHDEIVLECPEGQLEVVERILKETMVRACRDYLKVVAIPEPEVVVGHAWSKK